MQLLGIGSKIIVDGFECVVTDILNTGVELDGSRIISFQDIEKLI